MRDPGGIGPATSGTGGQRFKHCLIPPGSDIVYCTFDAMNMHSEILNALNRYNVDWKQHQKPFGLGGGVKPQEEEGDLPKEFFNHNNVCREASGFAQVC